MTRPSLLLCLLLFSSLALLPRAAIADPVGAANARQEVARPAPRGDPGAATINLAAQPLPWLVVGVLGLALVSALGWAGHERRRARYFIDELARTRVYFAAVARRTPKLPDRRF